MARTRLAVWGDPIAHSKSPDLHASAYRVLGLDWEYGRRQVAAETFESTFSQLDSTWRGLSLTMPLKEAAFRVAATRDRHAELTGAVNTLLLGDAPAGYNTDVGGIVDALAEAGVDQAGHVRILGAGATAASALVAASELGAGRVEIRARRPERAAALVDLGERIGTVVEVSPLDAPPLDVDLTIATLPSGTTLPVETATAFGTSGGTLFDAAYAPWPSALAVSWGEGAVVSGLGMLLHQAVRQIRIFHHGDPVIELPDEDAVIRAMRAAL
ncbi:MULTISPECIES: shikimate dehydrogenase [unclassified Microbacterium]|uniref:shikimate dehydrogenase family protein n=1 Tax=unclassified Microbacterium TaxID=2609290 RepID=UPI000CFA9119|nr:MULTISPECIES: shikimate dehydrogenase [unclassified Microbacterium]PQZ61008.1 shikimate dehydrogenase [Microbacterium sp. MYb43]PQZ82217.1 shikimate dehydrogenase [Microbacterium sp. MYb40]PRB24081.1 shikimate dehydrogenase [Microbacterium sp. MYb54]PRB30912.1 shikimate dehydrogenase [Microbacterium sp. MYb50]PRB70665.1 shikimate dehydrogenase [Microbacterium sp. MYb24]